MNPSNMKELGSTLVNTLVKRIEVHNSTVDENGVKHMQVDIHFTPDTEDIHTKPLTFA